MVAVLSCFSHCSASGLPAESLTAICRPDLADRREASCRRLEPVLFSTYACHCKKKVLPGSALPLILNGMAELRMP